MRLVAVIIVLFCSSLAFGHNPNVISMKMSKVSVGWQGQLSFGTYGLEGLLRDYLKDQKYKIRDDEQCRLDIEAFVNASVNLTINKSERIKISSVEMVITGHSVECYIHFIDFPPRSEFWEFDFEYLKSSNGLQHIVEFVSGNIRSKFLFEGESSIRLKKGAKDHFTRIT